MSGAVRQSLRLIAKNCLAASAGTGCGVHSALPGATRSSLSALAVAMRHLSTSSSTVAWQTQQRVLFSALPEQRPAEKAEAPELQLTDSAVEKLQELTAGTGERPLLRLTVEAGGCSGFSYKFDLDQQAREGDRVFETRGVKLVTDDVSLEFVRGAKVDYSQELIKAAFEVVDNPNAEKGCGCGSSFAPK